MSKGRKLDIAGIILFSLVKINPYCPNLLTKTKIATLTFVIVQFAIHFFTLHVHNINSLNICQAEQSGTSNLDDSYLAFFTTYYLNYIISSFFIHFALLSRIIKNYYALQ